VPRESKKARTERAGEILEILRQEYPDAWCSLDYDNPLQLLVATILAAQCTDRRVNIVTEDLFRKYDNAEDFARADVSELQDEIRSTGFFRNKSKSIIGAARKIVDEHDGQVPDKMEDLLKLPGVARKTANVVLGSAFHKNAGIVVDTHVTRLANRLRLTAHKTNAGDKIEKDLMDLIPQEDWTFFAHALVHHGRAICTARKPDCPNCPLGDLCPSAGKV
jgi:endonuclease-3